MKTLIAIFILFLSVGAFAQNPLLLKGKVLQLDTANGEVIQRWLKIDTGNLAPGFKLSSGFPDFPQDTTLFLRGDSTWSAPAGGGGGTLENWIATNAGSPVRAPLAGGSKAIAEGDSASASGWRAHSIGTRSSASGKDAFALGTRASASGDFSWAISNTNGWATATGIGDISWNATLLDNSQVNDGAHGYNIAFTPQGGGTTTSDAMNIALGYNCNFRGEGNTLFGANCYANGSAAGYDYFYGFGTGLFNPADAKYIGIIGSYGTISNPATVALLPHSTWDSVLFLGTTVSLYARNSQSVLIGTYNDTTIGGAFTWGTQHAFVVGNGNAGARSNALTVLKNGNVIAGGAIAATNFFPTSNYTQSAPADPSSTTSATPVMMGLAGTITPTQTGTITIIIDGAASQATANTTTNIQIAYGTGSAPANADAATGTTAGAVFHHKAGSAAQTMRTGFSRKAVITGLTLNAAYWIDLQVASSGGVGQAAVYDIEINAQELH